MKIKYLKWIGVGLYSCSLFLPAFFVETSGGGQAVHGAYCLMAGWMMAMGGGVGLIWLANPVLLLAMFLPIHKVKWKMALICIALLLSLYFTQFDKCMIGSSGMLHPIVQYSFGYYFWILSQLTFLIFVLLQSRKMVKF